jgi:Holliday junction DNA helicase RuvA
MYEYIEGKLAIRNPAYAVIEAGGIGYGLTISLNTYSKIEHLERIRLFTHLAFKIENTNPVGMDLFGFFDEKERILFRHLISVSRVGNSTAMMMLSAMSPQEITEAVITGNALRLQAVKGIGAKAAQRIIMELKDKLDKDGMEPDKSVGTYNLNQEEALSGLVMLGFNKNQANKALQKIAKSQQKDLTVEQLIKEALKIL